VDRIFRFTIKHPRLSLLFSLLIALPFLTYLPKVQTPENADLFTVEGDPDVAYYERFKEVFGHDEFFVIAFRQANIFTEKNLSLLRDLSSRLEEIEEVRKVVSLATVDDVIGEEDYFLVQGFLHRIPSDTEALEELKNRAVRNPLYLGRLISGDGATTALAVLVYEKTEDTEYRKRLMEKTFGLLRQYDPSGSQFHVAGGTLTNLRLSQHMKADVSVFIPMVYLIVMVTIFIIFRDLRITLLSFINVSLCLSCTMGFIAVVGSTMNNITSIVPPLIMALSLADTVHVFTHYLSNRRKGMDTGKAVLKTVRQVYKPCLLTSVTTIAGFMSLRLSHIPLIQDFAVIASMGVALAFIFSFLFLPAAIMLLPPAVKEKSANVFIDSILRKIVQLHVNHGKTILMICLSCVGASLFFLTEIKVETDLLKFFKKGNPLRQSTEFINKHLAGTLAIDVSIIGRKKDAFKEPENLQFIADVQNHVASLSGIDVVNSLADYIKDMNESFHNEDDSYHRIPETRELVAQYFLLYDSEDIGDFINPSYNHARIIARTDRYSTRDQKIIIEEIEHFLREKTPDGLDARVTGAVTQLVKVSEEMVRGQIVSLSMAVMVISVMMFLAFRSFSLGLLSLIPNAFPILMNFGIMGAMGIPLNTATALISAVAIGIAVDDTIHFLHQYREERRKKKDRSEAIRKTILIKGKAMLTTSIILAAGFGVLLFSAFTPTVQFGGLATCIMLTALMGDLLLLPAILGLDMKHLP
jgi:predicted RND superfamily exporter protein